MFYAIEDQGVGRPFAIFKFESSSERHDWLIDRSQFSAHHREKLSAKGTITRKANKGEIPWSDPNGPEWEYQWITSPAAGMTTTEAAAELARIRGHSISRRRIAQLIAAGKIKAIKRGRDWDVDAQSIVEYAAQAGRKAGV